MSKTRSSDEIEQLKAMVAELKEELSNRNNGGPDIEVDELRSELAELRSQMVVARNSQAAWFEEVDELYNDFKIKN